MKLRTRLMSALLCLLIILLLMGLYSINQCSQLGKQIERIGLENDKVGREVRAMKHSGASMTGALLMLAVGDAEKSRNQFNEASATFDKNLQSEQARAADAGPEEKKVIAKLAESYTTYTNHAQKLLAEPPQPGTPWRDEANQLGKETAQVLDLVEQISAAHQAGLTKEGQESSNRIIGSIRLLWFMMGVAAVATLLAYIGLNRGLLTPLKSITASIKKIGEGNLDQQVPVGSTDELGVLSVSFNQMAEQLREYQANTSVTLLRLNETIRATIASFPDPVFVLNKEGEVDFRNPAADQLAVKLLFAGVTRLPAKVDSKVEEVRASGKDYLPNSFQEAVKFHIDGQDRYYLPRMVMLRSEKDETFGVAVILEDVTRMLLLDDVKSNMIATVSHELKTPMTSIRMALYLLHENTLGSLNAKQADLVEAAREDSDRLLKTLNDLLDLAKMEQGSSPLQLRTVQPRELVESAERATREVIHAGGLILRVDVAPGLPDVQIDPQRMAYVLTNFITNAVKYSPAGSEIMLAAAMGRNRSGTPSVRFSVRDHGSGIAPEHQDHVFERFYRVPGTTKSGAGLGLSIAREIVAAHQGEIGVISPPDSGSEFFFVLPVTQPAAKALA